MLLDNICILEQSFALTYLPNVSTTKVFEQCLGLQLPLFCCYKCDSYCTGVGYLGNLSLDSWAMAAHVLL